VFASEKGRLHAEALHEPQIVLQHPEWRQG
jgi:hypothetical protein